jgi:hypothetical protein
MLMGLQEKQFSIEYSITEPDGSTRIDRINASFELSIKKVPKKVVME